MKKGDKLIAVLGVFILIVAAVGIYYWVEEEPIEKKADVEDFFEVSSEFEMIPDAITVSDSCPYYAVIATPLAVNFDEEGTKNVIPLFIENADEVSTAVTKIGIPRYDAIGAATIPRS